MITAVAYAVYRARLRSSRFTNGTVISIEERIVPGGEGITWHPRIRFKTLDGGEAEFQSGWGMERHRWYVGELVSVKVYDGSPELYDPRLVRVAVTTGIVLGGMMIFGPFLTTQ